jgi:hypothetical protein
LKADLDIKYSDNKLDQQNINILLLLTSINAAATSECFGFVLAINISQNTDHHSNRNPPGASIAEK